MPRGMNPNMPDEPYKPTFPQRAKPMQPGAANPFGFGREQTAGRVAIQRNRPGMPTNTVPLPAIQRGRNPMFRPRLGAY